MFWFILLGVSLVLTILGIVFVVIDNCFDYIWGYLGIVFIIVFGATLMTCSIAVPINYVECQQQVANFERQKAYFETVVPTLSSTDNINLTQNRLVLNEWLYKAQYEKTHWSFFSFYSDKVLELEEII